MFDLGGVLSEAVSLAQSALPDPTVLTLVHDDDLLLFAARAEELGRIADAMRIAVAGEVGERSRTELGEARLSRRRGCTTPAELIERLTLVAAETARMRLRTAAGIRPRTSLTGEPLPAAFPRVAHAVMAGEIGIDAATAIIGALAPIRERIGAVEDLDGAEAELIEAALGSDEHGPCAADEVRIMAQTWALYLDPDGALPDSERAMRGRALTKGRLRNGLVPWRGDVLPEVSAQLETLLDAHNNPAARSRVAFENDDGTASSETDDAVPRDPRTPAQCNHDALSAILRAAAGAAGTPSLGGAAPTLVVTVDAEQLARADGIAFLATHEAGDTGAVGSVVARHIACMGRVQRLVLDPDGRVLELGTPERVFSGSRRRAIAARDGECIVPGCHVPAMWCEVHHVLDHARGGPTHTDNGVLLCWWHHRTIETSGWEIRMVDGVPWVRAPRWLDSARRWRQSSGSPVRRLTTLSRAPAVVRGAVRGREPTHPHYPVAVRP